MESYASRYRVKDLFLVYPMQQKMTTPIQMHMQGSGATLTILPFDVTANPSVDLPKIGVGS